MIEKNIHQVFYTHKNPITKFPVFIEKQKRTEFYCKRKDISYFFWDNKKIDELLNEEGHEKYKQYFYEMINQENQTKICCAFDFIRFLILFKYGGIYMDLDLDIVKEDISDLFLKNKIFLNSCPKGNLNNNLIGCNKNNKMLTEILDYIIESFNTKKIMKVYDQWVFRFVCQTTGGSMLKRFFKLYKYDYEVLEIITFINNKKFFSESNGNSIVLCNNVYFIDSCEVSWWISPKNK